MKIVKFGEYIKENLHDTAEQYVNIALSKLKRKIESFFESEEEKESEEGLIKMSDAIKRGKEKEKEESQISFAELGLTLVSSEFSRYSSMNDSLKIILSDEQCRYDLIFIIPLEEAKVKDTTKDSSDKDIKKIFIKFKKYDSTKDFELIGQINKNMDFDLEKITPDLIVNLKIELDDEFLEDQEKLEIETE
jgi:hypothetical protein